MRPAGMVILGRDEAHRNGPHKIVIRNRRWQASGGPAVCIKTTKAQPVDGPAYDGIMDNLGIILGSM